MWMRENLIVSIPIIEMWIVLFWTVDFNFCLQNYWLIFVAKVGGYYIPKVQEFAL